VGRVGDQDLVGVAAGGVVPGPHEQQPGELALGACRGLQGRRGGAGDRAQGQLQPVQQGEPALDLVGRLSGVTTGQAGQAGDHVADLGVVFHRARPQRVGAVVDGVVPGAEPGEVGDQVPLRHLG
jgi:hypothetical protein